MTLCVAVHVFPDLVKYPKYSFFNILQCTQLGKSECIGA